jgi:hypothetical protein
VQSLELFGLHSKSSLGDLSHNGSCSTDGVSLGLRLWLLLLDNSLDLIEITIEDGSIRHVFCGF